jgi:hypothetical protein
MITTLAQFAQVHAAGVGVGEAILADYVVRAAVAGTAYLVSVCVSRRNRAD